MPHHSSNITGAIVPVNTQGRFSPPVMLTVEQFSSKHPCFTKGSIRSLIFYARNRESSNGRISGNGLENALVRVGRRVLINEELFFSWLDTQSNG
ncbi:hypothetical protein SAMN05216308_102260 [Nitrosospira sp. Nsp13]|nr:hypothetical protein SAMN05216308_102260 [Nitrosospira sp. Nsp13]